MSGYDSGGASLIKKTLKSWRPLHLSAQSDIDRNLKLLRARAADLAMNSPLGAAAIQTLSTGVIGAGLKLFPRIRREVLGLSGEEARAWSRHVKAEFELWATSPAACDYLKRNSFAELQQIAFMSYLVDGDSFALFKRRLPTLSNPYSLRLQLVEAGRISNPDAGGVEEIRYGANRIVNGIEVDAQGVQVAIWVSNRQWDELTTTQPAIKWKRVKWFGERSGCRNVLHICRDTRPNMFRGVPLLAPAIECLKQVARYADAELSGSIIRAFFSIFFTQQQHLGINDTLGEEVDVDKVRINEPMVMSLPPGTDVKSIGSQNAQSTFEPFITSFVKQMAASINLPAEVLMKSFNASYSASRAALLQAEDTYRQYREAFKVDFLSPVYEMWLSEAVALGRIDAPGFEDPARRSAYLGADWFAEKTSSLDPLKEAQAAHLKLESGLTTYTKTLMENEGLDFTEIAEQLTEERAMLRTVLDNKAASD